MDLLVVDVPVFISDKIQQSIVFEDVEVPQIQFFDRVVDIPVSTQRRLPTVQTVQKTGEIPLVQFWTRFVSTARTMRMNSTSGSRRPVSPSTVQHDTEMVHGGGEGGSSVARRSLVT